jgi:peptidoglycan/LPS O-acetylase OafA/YrhL
MLFHIHWALLPIFDGISRFGWAGVDLFFVLSGYLIGSQLLKPYLHGSRPSLIGFYRRRAYRILPAYLMVVLFYFTVPNWREAAVLAPLWQFLTFTENLLIHWTTNHAFSHVWSLCVEEHFYLAFPVLVLAMMRKPSIRKTAFLLTALVAVGIAIRSYILVHELQPLGDGHIGFAYIAHIYAPTYSRLDGLLAGVSLALIKIFRPIWWSAIARHGHSTLCGGIILIAVSLWMFKDRFLSTHGVAALGAIIGFPVLSLGLALLVASSISNNGALSRFRVPGAKLLATLAFTLYLTHKSIVNLDYCYLPTLMNRDIRATLICAATCFLAAGSLYFCVERPFMLLRDRLDRRPAGKVDVELRTEPAL